MNINHYAYRVIWSEEDHEHIGLCSEFPSLSWLDDSPEKALSGIQKTVQAVVTDMEQSAEPIPQPISERSYSGKFQVRIPAEIHRHLALEAAEQGVSLNRLISARLST